MPGRSRVPQGGVEGLTCGSSLDYIYRKKGAVPIEVVGKVAEAVLRGLLYLYDTHRIIHRGMQSRKKLSMRS